MSRFYSILFVCVLLISCEDGDDNIKFEVYFGPGSGARGIMNRINESGFQKFNYAEKSLLFHFKAVPIPHYEGEHWSYLRMSRYVCNRLDDHDAGNNGIYYFVVDGQLVSCFDHDKKKYSTGSGSLSFFSKLHR